MIFLQFLDPIQYKPRWPLKAHLHIYGLYYFSGGQFTLKLSINIYAKGIDSLQEGPNNFGLLELIGIGLLDQR